MSVFIDSIYKKYIFLISIMFCTHQSAEVTLIILFLTFIEIWFEKYTEKKYNQWNNFHLSEQSDQHIIFFFTIMEIVLIQDILQ